MTVSDILRVASNGKSHTGKYREENQDTIRIHEPLDEQSIASHGHVYAIADGMGGYSHGAVASSVALETFFDAFYSAKSGKPAQNLRNAINQANLAVFQMAQRLGAVRMGTTLSAVNLIGNQLFLSHIGDSRIYLVRQGKATCLTQDHTTVGDLVRMRILTPDKVRTHEQRSILNKCIGIELFIQPDISQITLHQDDVIILCCDGVWSVIQDDEFAGFSNNISNPESLAQTLIDLAMERDSDDNVSSIVVRVEQLAPASEMVNAEGHTWSLGQFLRQRFSGKA